MTRQYQAEVATRAVDGVSRLKHHIAYLDEFWERFRALCKHDFADLAVLLKGDFFFTITMATKATTDEINRLSAKEAGELRPEWRKYSACLSRIRPNSSKALLDQCHNAFEAFKKEFASYRAAHESVKPIVP